MTTPKQSRIASIIESVDIPATTLERYLEQFFSEKSVAATVAPHTTDATYMKDLAAICANGAVLATLATTLQDNADYEAAKRILVGKDFVLLCGNPIFFTLLAFLFRRECAPLPRGHVAHARRDELVRAVSTVISTT